MFICTLRFLYLLSFLTDIVMLLLTKYFLIAILVMNEMNLSFLGLQHTYFSSILSSRVVYIMGCLVWDYEVHMYIHIVLYMKA